MTARIVCAWSGGAEAWARIAAAAAARAAEIVTLTLDLGQGTDLEEVRDRALASGAVRAHVLDVREEFARDHVLPALHAHALQADPEGQQLAARLVARKLEEVAAIEGATPVMESIAIDGTLLGRHGAAYALTKASADAPSAPAHVEIAFEHGVPVAINGVSMALTELIEILTIIAGHHGVGRIGLVEAPAAVVLMTAYAALAGAFPPTDVTGVVRLTLLKGDHTVSGVSRPMAEPS
jgi:argininosuccinate synthase